MNSGSSIGSLAAVSPALSPYIGKKDSSDYEPPVGVVEPRTILSHLDNALDIAEMHKGQGAILEKVSVVTKPKTKLGHHNSGFSAGSSDNLIDTPSPGSSLHSRGVFPNKRKKSSIANFMDKALPNRKKKSFKKVTLNLEAGEELNEVSDVNPIQSFTDDDVLDLDHEKRIRAKVESEVGNKSQNNCLESPTIKSATLSTQSSLPDYNEVIKDVRKNDVMHARKEDNASPKSTLAHQDISKFLTFNQHQRKLSTSLTIDDDDDWDKRSIWSIRSCVSNNTPGSPSGLGSTTSEAVTDEERKVIKEQELKEERRERFWDYFTFIGSMVWAMLIVVIGCVLYAQDIFVHGHKRGSHRTQYYNMCLCILGIIIFITLIVDINKYISMMKTYWQKGAEAPKIELVEGEDGESLISIPISAAPKKLPQYYGFTTGRHSGSMFLKIGAAVFGVLHIIHLFLIIVKEAITLQSNDCCESRETITRNFFHVIFVVLQLYMTFKYSNVIVNRSKGLARFAFMHCIGSSLCFWINTIIDETLDTLVEKLTKSEDTCHPEDYHLIYGPDYYNNSSMIHGQFEECNVNNRSNLEMCTKKIYNWAERCYKADPSDPIVSFNVDCLLAKECMCTYDNHAANTIFRLGPFLYPFGIEFSLLVVGVLYIMWDNIGRVKENQRGMEFIPDARRDSINSVDGTPINEALLVYADCHSTSTGLFVGLILFAFSTTGFIVFLVLSGSPDCDNQSIAVTLNDVIEIMILLVMIVVSFYLYGWKIAHLDVNPNPISFLDDLLLIVCLPSSFFYCILSILPSVTGDYSDPGNVMTQICMMVQVIIQTALIVDGLRRCSDGQHNQVQRPGKNLITFLIVANLSLWLWETMEAKATGEYYHIRKKYYGAELWTIIAHTTLPLSIFYRFHSAVALADIWSSAYKPGDHH